MIKTTRASLTARIALLVASLAVASLLVGPVAAGAATTIVYSPESLSVYEQQLDSGKIRAVTINKHLRSLRVTLDDGSYVLARYKPKEEKKAGRRARSQARARRRADVLGSEQRSQSRTEKSPQTQKSATSLRGF